MTDGEKRVADSVIKICERVTGERPGDPLEAARLLSNKREELGNFDQWILLHYLRISRRKEAAQTA